jgi:hypothetical protein
MEATCSSSMSLDVSGLHGVIYQKTEFLFWTRHYVRHKTGCAVHERGKRIIFHIASIHYQKNIKVKEGKSIPVTGCGGP